jgi:hypothetical protein
MRLERLVLAFGPAMTCQSARSACSIATSIQQIMIAPIDTKVSIGTFVQLIRIVISGSIKKFSRI